jgi:heme-degrading monooxygenase HmoA
MFARVSEVSGASDRVDAGIAHYRDVVLPEVEQMPGFERAYLLIDRGSGRSLSITVWDSEDAMSASDEAAGRLRAQAAATVSGQASVSYFEVAIAAPAS